VFACLIYEGNERVVVIAACYAGPVDRAKAVMAAKFENCVV
jgi:hypothetical protein